MIGFVVGQRWISASEPELGLGIVTAVAANRVTISYLASDERRVYAQDNAPLTRVRFSIDDNIETNNGQQGRVTAINEYEGVIHYQVLSEQGKTISVDETALSHHIQFNKPQDKLFIGQAEEGRWFTLRYQTWQHLHRLHKSQVKGLLGARTSLIAHQLYIAHEVAQRDKVRVMLADEVGLGKTIEAGLILHHRLHMGLSERILVIVPESLLHQWLVEMFRRFNLKFSLFDESRCEAYEDDNPFLSEQLVLCSLDFFTQNPHRREQAVQSGWDIVVVDEAHHLQWTEHAPGNSYLFIEQLAEHTSGLILLTATPEQLGKETHFAQLRLLDADRFYSFEQFLVEQKEFEPIARLAEKIVHQILLNDVDKKLLASLVDQKLTTDFLHNIEDITLRQDVIDQLIDRHGTGRILFRNSRHVVQGFPQREVYTYPLQQQTGESENIYLQWLVTQLNALDKFQVLLICKNTETVISLHKQLRDKYAFNVAVFHEGMSIIERDRAAAYFADQDARVQVLLCSEIGSEGRNFQFVHHLILLELPENPDLLQQRIGRLDRIGQKHIIKIHVPYIIGSKQHSLCCWYEEGLKLFQVNSNAASEVYRLQKQPLTEVCLSKEQQGLDPLVVSGKMLLAEIEAQMHQARDVLLELNSYRQEVAENLITAIENISQPQVLWRYMEDIFDCFGVDSEYHSEDCAILQAGQLQRVSHFPGLPEDGVTVTVNREIALAREDMQYLTWEHPMLVSAMDLVLSGNIGNAALSIIKHKELVAGQYLLECLFLVECSAPMSLQLSRFLPATPIRILMDQKQQDLTAYFQHDELYEVEDKIETEQIAAFINGEHKNINAMIASAQQKSETIMQAIISQTNTEMLKVLAKEIKRLDALRHVNSGIKPEEIRTLKNSAIASHGYIKGAKLRLDAVRFIITS
ncbi:RNA polymerase-associated protein RapA [Methyloprofundus sedimenti]|uniref:RNA polymerase-associated protein RapA n=1 Tax=Methyloprofundus sedimenti TaxID=1420851 RepID=A0A1V8MAY6_9GAMM|nr:RNA polymerase-associated protein RapA [Methyloprofundus sedimenti]OQK18668.1 RNA polymerase-associated protein RapA [Methyloprofundus sedimenti]